MVRYDPYTDSFIDNPTKETTATINLEALPKSIIQLNVVDVSDASVEKIADAVVRKLRAEQTEPNSSEIPNNCDEPQTDCLTCRYNSDEWDSPKCDGCSKAHSNYEPQTDCAWK